MVFGSQKRSQDATQEREGEIVKNNYLYRLFLGKTYIFQCWAFRRQTKNRRKIVVKGVSITKSILRGFWGGFGDGFGWDFGGLGRSWGGKREAKRRKKGKRKGKQKKEAKEEANGVASAGDAVAA